MIKFCATGATQVLAAVGGLLLAAVISRTGGPAQLGMFTVMLSLIGVLSMIARRGQGSLLTRGVAWAIHRKGAQDSVALLVLAFRRILLLSALLGLAGSAVLRSGVLGSPFLGAVYLLPFIVLMVTSLALFAAYARGSARPWLAPFFEIGGISFLTVILLMPWLMSGGALTPAGVMCALLLSMLGLALAAGVIARRDHPVTLEGLYPDDDLRDELSRGQVPFMLIALSGFLIQSGSFLLAAPFLSETDVGLLRGAERLALLVGFCALVINPVIAPGIVRLARGGDMAGLWRLTLRAVMASSGIAACMLLPLLIWPERALALMGAEFAAAVPYLQLMACAQFLAAGVGPLAVMLNMSGRERVSMWINVGTLTLAFVLVPGLSLAYEATGFAVAYAAIVVTRLCAIGAAVFLSRPATQNGARRAG